MWSDCLRMWSDCPVMMIDYVGSSHATIDLPYARARGNDIVQSLAAGGWRSAGICHAQGSAQCAEVTQDSIGFRCVDGDRRRLFVPIGYRVGSPYARPR